MNETNKDQNNYVPAVTKQDTVKLEMAKSKALVPYDEEEAKTRKKGIISNLRRRTPPSRAQLRKLLMENIVVLPEHEARLLSSVFDLTVLTAQEVMMPLSEMTLLTITSSPSEISQFCSEFNYRYIPIYSERVDRLIGVVDAMEVLTAEQDANDLSLFVRDTLYVPPLKSVMDLLGELRQFEVPAAVVVNEHGSCIGIVELVDILEKVVGKITTNRRRDTPHIEKLGNSDWLIDARALIVDVNMALNIEIPTDRCDTVGGFVLMLLGRLPQKGEKLEYEKLEFNIDEVFKYGISRIQVTKKAQKSKK
jgi:CBS domain containing-hemolysin-like protein